MDFIKTELQGVIFKDPMARMILFQAGRQPMSISPAMCEVSSGLHRWLHRKTVLLKSMCRH